MVGRVSQGEGGKDVRAKSAKNLSKGTAVHRSQCIGDVCSKEGMRAVGGLHGCAGGRGKAAGFVRSTSRELVWAVTPVERRAPVLQQQLRSEFSPDCRNGYRAKPWPWVSFHKCRSRLALKASSRTSPPARHRYSPH